MRQPKDSLNRKIIIRKVNITLINTYTRKCYVSSSFDDVLCIYVYVVYNKTHLYWIQSNELLFIENILGKFSTKRGSGLIGLSLFSMCVCSVFCSRMDVLSFFEILIGNRYIICLKIYIEFDDLFSNYGSILCFLCVDKIIFFI